MKYLLACVLLLLYGHGAQASNDVDATLDTPAQAAVRKLPKEFINVAPTRRFSTRDDNEEAASMAAIRLEEIRVYDQMDPEDYVRRRTALQQFQTRLEKDRPMTPKEKTQLAMCFIGLCAIYGPDGIPREPSLAERSEARTNQSTAQLITQFRGTLQ